MNSDSKLICAWVTRHNPTVEQIKRLRQWQIVQILPPVGERFRTGYQVWNTLERVCKTTPDLIVAVLPDCWGQQFTELASRHAPDTPIVRAVMMPPDYRHWSGRWQAWYRADEWYDWKP